MPSHSIDELFKAYEKLPKRHHQLMHIWVADHLGNIPWTSTTDLIHEVIDRHATEQRNWPHGVELHVYIANCARSIATDYRRSMAAKNLSLDAMLGDGDANFEWMPPRIGRRMPSVESTEEVILSRERLLRCREAIEAIRDELRDDPLARKVLAGILADMTPAEMRSAYGERESQIKAARQRVHNRLKAWREEHPL